MPTEDEETGEMLFDCGCSMTADGGVGSLCAEHEEADLSTTEEGYDYGEEEG